MSSPRMLRNLRWIPLPRCSPAPTENTLSPSRESSRIASMDLALRSETDSNDLFVSCSFPRKDRGNECVDALFNVSVLHFSSVLFT